MTANELADKLQNEKAKTLLYVATIVDSANMLRQQAKEIESLKKKLENLPMSLKDDIEYWSEKIACNKCNDTGWVCEWHPDKEAHKCCGGAGMPCECIGGEK